MLIPDIRPVYNSPWQDGSLANPPILAPRWRTATDTVFPPLCGNLGCRPPKTPVRTIGLGAMHSDLNASGLILPQSALRANAIPPATEVRGFLARVL